MLRRTRGKGRQGMDGRKHTNSTRSLSRVDLVENVPTLALGHIFRFNSGSNSGTFPVTRGQLLDLYCMSTGADSGTYRIFNAVKLGKVDLWSNPPGLGSDPTTVSIEWLGVNAPSISHSDTTMGVRPACVKTKPPPNSSDRWWSISGSNETEVLFKITCPANTIVDVSITIRCIDNEAATLITDSAGVSGATLGTIYYNYLDGLSSGKLAPVGDVQVLP